MKFYETSDTDFYIDVPNGWESYCRYPAKKKWSYKPLNKIRSINYYRDIDSVPSSKRDCYQLGNKNWPENRINPWACLPLLYSNGVRFIKLTQAPPLDFKCAEFPMNLKEFRAKRKALQQKAKEKAAKEYFKKMLDKECKKSKAVKGKQKPRK